MPLGVAIAGANRPDYQWTAATLADMASHDLPRPEPTAEEPPGLSLDQGYFDEEIYELLETWGYTAHIRPLGSGQAATLTPEEAREAGVKARRWVVERTHSWLNRFRGLLIRWCKKPENYLAMLHFSLCADHVPSCWPIEIGTYTKRHQALFRLKPLMRHTWPSFLK